MEAYYIKSNDETYYVGVVTHKWKDKDINSKSNKKVVWLSIDRLDNGQTVFMFPKRFLKADKLSKESLISLGLIEKNKRKSLLCKIFCLH